jgi:ABC-type ATPase involved in cell division
MEPFFCLSNVSHFFQNLISKGTFMAYENRVYLAGACNVGKSTLTSILLGEEIPQRWKSTNGLVIYFGRNGIHLKDKKMVPLRKGNTT